ncbi:MAG: hypothetical protein A2474_05810 [Elusimicrobia bacterium RIFOXYC2_FULL_34_12]|nr:MAG: hypothetical protein A2474_05810 [Elusimicrobia bacterium RIFOXYC2_FULL_34_12]OGS38775.1 MAG: hypothetical protein A2551_01070 [Elusimicrobia bacterium RIFOXYD2_FULL_34_30]
MITPITYGGFNLCNFAHGIRTHWNELIIFGIPNWKPKIIICKRFTVKSGMLIFSATHYYDAILLLRIRKIIKNYYNSF